MTVKLIRGSMTLAIYKDGACTKALIMDIMTYLVKLYQSKGYNNFMHKNTLVQLAIHPIVWPAQ
jgi:hypothetical protein